jgi:hypothetical protein
MKKMNLIEKKTRSKKTMKFNYTIVAWKENGDSPEVLERVDEALLAEERRDYWSNKNQENVTHITVESIDFDPTQWV